MINHRFFNRQLSNIALVLASLLLLWVLVAVAFDFYKLKKAQPTPSPTKSATTIKQTSKKYRIQDVISANLLGDPVIAKVEVRQAPKTTLNLTLEGIMYSGDKKSARAMIKVGSNKTKLYAVGDKLEKADASVEEIHSEKVLLNRRGAIEGLPLIKKKLGAGNTLAIQSYQPPEIPPEVILNPPNPRQSRLQQQRKQKTTPSLLPTF